MSIQSRRAKREAFQKAGDRRLLLLACSQRKVATAGKLPALRRYDGPAYQVLRRYLREATDRGLVIRILSAEYGLITATTCIENYDRKMDPERAAQLRSSCLGKLRILIRENEFAEVFVCMSRVYRGAVDGIESFCECVKHAAPGQGPKLSSLRSWLWGEPIAVL